MASSHSAVNPGVTGPSLSDFPENIQNKIILVEVPAAEVQGFIRNECPYMLERIAPYGANWMRHVMYNTIPKEIRVYAYVHYDMAQPDWYRKEGNVALLSRYNAHRNNLEQEVTEEQARSMLRFYSIVQFYANPLPAIGIRALNVARSGNMRERASRNEMLRIERALYIHDILLQAMTNIPRHTMTSAAAKSPWMNFLEMFTGWMLYQVLTVTTFLHYPDHTKRFSDEELEDALVAISKTENRNYLYEGLSFRKEMDGGSWDRRLNDEEQLRLKCWAAAGRAIFAAMYLKVDGKDQKFNQQNFSPDDNMFNKQMADPFVFIEGDNGPHRLWYAVLKNRPNQDIGTFFNETGHPNYLLFMWDEDRLRYLNFLGLQ
ncbi:hypothetical protein AtubIFM55763_003487 [Aspergillus tubingensis]|uniref:Uncharacterized protein n=2 Tax=Aspergillus subgen. Circumdati TaxID=2720871 RepID=A0A100ILM4_ASPNG|nr:amino acid permease family protein [Aspergillus tubingensis]GAQ43195.1 hypothetical protein ASPNIDRAFT_41107 [Aspergillus niger]GFN19820.1 amino acid permease family protein [Aspergillus tubingensis]GLA63614.1 hypothetical protein AtubIFM54640_004768 [Aspergillus tubingensis]GLA68416.1 hypothetical protein AtubIFM55763_003487 [Aspergillus tubingensis]GLA87353.1 hypothetical protein AtubIFM56815_001777 [Aspergillus tubingensis]